MIQSLVEPLDLLHIPYRIYSLSRGFAKISQKTFKSFEQGKTPFPCPFFRVAAFAICSQPTPEHPGNILPLALPINSEGLIDQRSLVDCMGHIMASNPQFASFTAAMSQRPAEIKRPEDNPFLYKTVGYGEAFMPLAYFDLELKKPLSAQGLEAMEAINQGIDTSIADNPAWEWEDLGIPMTGLAELLVRAKDKECLDTILKLLEAPSLPIIGSLCSFLLHTKMTGKLLKRWTAVITDTANKLPYGDERLASLVLSLASSNLSKDQEALLNFILEYRTAEDLAIIATFARYFGKRCEDPTFRKLLVEKVIGIHDPATAGNILLDLYQQTSASTLVGPEAKASYSKDTLHKLASILGL